MRKPHSVMENETQKVLKDFMIQTDQLIQARRPGLVIINKKKRRKKKKKKTCRLVDFAVPADHRVKIKESEKRDKEICETWG